MTKKILLIGWDAADWKVINPLLDEGKMPALSRLVNNGVIGNLATLDPPLSPMLWTSIATGKRADKHGIIGFMEPDVKNGGIRHINSTSRKTHALWNILGSRGMKCNVVGWWPSHPAEPINGVMVSNFFQKQNDNIRKWPFPRQSVHPKKIVPELMNLRIHYQELTHTHLLPFLPAAVEFYQMPDYKEKYEKRIAGLSKIIAENSTIHAATTWLMENTEWDLTAVYFDGIDHAGHGYMKFHPPQLPGLPDDMFKLFRNVVEGMYIFHDMMLERMLQLAGKDTTVIIVSDHGFHPDHLRKLDLPKHAAAPALEHRPFGIICMAGNNIQKDERIYGASLLDITPTVLAMFGLAVGQDMDGKILMNAFEKPPLPEYIESWDQMEGDFGTHPADLQEDSFASAEAMKQLVDLGYVEDFGEDKAKAMEKTVIEGKYNLARVYMNKNDFCSAIPFLEELVAADDKDPRFLLALSKCRLQLKEYDAALDIINQLRTLDDRHIPNTDMLEAMVYNQRGQIKKAYDILMNIKDTRFPGINFLCEIGKVLLKMNKADEALSIFEDVLKVDDSHVYAHFGKGKALLKKNQYEEAAESLLTAIGLQYFNPAAHGKLGEALFYMGQFAEAGQAFEIALMQAPRSIAARQWLKRIYSEKIIDAEKAQKNDQEIKQMTKKTIYVVSGLPRSGTSMMMQMLQAAGMEIFTDQKRLADDNNPKGYLEHDAVKALARDKSWLPSAEGKTVKIIAQLLQFLPPGYNYKIIFMQRDMNEIIMSQQKMLGKKTDTLPLQIITAFEKTLENVNNWAEKSPFVEIIKINYKDVIENPDEAAENISSFIGLQLDTELMAEAVSSDLYRNKH